MQIKNPYRVLLVDDHPLVIDGLKAMLETVTHIELQFAFMTGHAITQHIKNASADVLLLDISLPDVDGISVCKEIRKINNQIRIIGLSSHGERSIILGLIAAGANGFLLKNVDRRELIFAIESVIEGRQYFCAESMKAIQSGDDVCVSDAGAIVLPVLTRREKEILELVSEGCNTSEIAGKLFLSPLTISTHKKNLYRKFNANNVQTLLRKGREFGFI